MPSPVKYRLARLDIFILVGVAMIADLLTLIPLAGTVVSPVYWGFVTFYLHRKGFGWVNGKRAATSVISMIAEVIPAIQALPLVLAGTVVIIALSRLEDRTGRSMIGKNIPTAPGGRQPLNQGGIRQPTPPQTPGNRNENLRPLVVDGIRAPNG